MRALAVATDISPPGEYGRFCVVCSDGSLPVAVGLGEGTMKGRFDPRA